MVGRSRASLFRRTLGEQAVRVGKRSGWRRAILASFLVAGLSPAVGQSHLPDNLNLGNSYHYVANTPPPDAFLALRTHPNLQTGLRITTLPAGTLLDVLERRSDRWWYVRLVPSGQQGWVLSGEGKDLWIECCRMGLNDPKTESDGGS
jgi:hypothetical protein